MMLSRVNRVGRSRYPVEVVEPPQKLVVQLCGGGAPKLQRTIGPTGKNNCGVAA